MILAEDEGPWASCVDEAPGLIVCEVTVQDVVRGECSMPFNY